MADIGLMDVILTVAVALIWIAVGGLLVYALVTLARRVVGRTRVAASPADPALDALRMRFARGEIDEAEYRRLRSDLDRG
jgi:uncharacterized membrane protein